MGLGKTLTMIALILRSRELRKDNEENVTASPRGTRINKYFFQLSINMSVSFIRYEEGQNARCVPS
jgi:hypothetical protein